MNPNEAFLSELKALMAKFGVKIVGNDQYDGADEYAGTSYHFEGRDIRVEIADLSTDSA